MDEGHAQRVVEVLEAEGPTMPLVVLARRLEILPSRLVARLDDLYDAGVVTPGRERGTVSLVPQPRELFEPPAPAARLRR